jgi:predicted nucleotidyltransferase
MNTLALVLPYEALETFCQKWGIIELSLFGSALRPDFDPQHSDIDLLFKRQTPHRIQDILGMEEELEAIFGRPVDIIPKQAVEDDPNYIRRAAILNSAQVIYAN